jgi:WD40 repeat protein
MQRGWFTLKIRLLMLVLLTTLSPVFVSAEFTACPATTALVFANGETGSVTEGLSSHLRAEPALEGEVLATLAAGSTFTVQAEPVCADDLRWWQVKADDLTGWLAEGSNTGDYYLQLTDSAPPSIDNSALLATWGMGQLTDVAWSPDGSKMAVASTSGVWIYAANDFNAPPRLLTENAQRVVSVAFDPAHPNMLYTANGDRSLSRWDVAFGSVTQIGRFDAAIRSISFGTTGQVLAVLLTNGDAALLPAADFANMVQIPAEKSLDGLYTSALLSHDETMLALGTDAGSVEVFNRQGRRFMRFAVPEKAAAIVSFNLDDSLIAISSKSGQTLQIMNVSQQTVYVEKNFTDQRLENLFFLPGGQLLTLQSANGDRMLVVYSVGFVQEEYFYGAGYLPQPDGDKITFFNFHQFNNRLVSIMNGNPARVSNGAAPLVQVMTTSDFVLSADGSRLIHEVVGGFDVIDTQTNAVITHIPHSPALAGPFALSADGRYFAVCANQDTLSWQPFIEVYDLTTVDAAGTPLNRLAAAETPNAYGLDCDTLAFVSTPAWQQVVSNHSLNGMGLLFWDFTKEQVFSIQPLAASRASFASDTLLRGTKFITSRFDNSSAPYYDVMVDVYDALQPDTAPLTITVDWVRGDRYYGMLKAILLTDTTLAVTAGYEGRDLVLFDLTSLTQTMRIPTPSAISALATTADGTWIATAHNDGIIRLWNVAQPATPVILGKVSETLTQLTFSPDAQRLYANGSIWDVSHIIDD